MSILEHDFAGMAIRALVIAYDKYVDVYATDYDYNIAKYDDDLTVRIRVVDAIQPRRVAGEGAWIVWFEVLDDQYPELISPRHIVKIVYW